jgi:hypothetical protein
VPIPEHPYAGAPILAVIPIVFSSSIQILNLDHLPTLNAPKFVGQSLLVSAEKRRRNNHANISNQSQLFFFI